MQYGYRRSSSEESGDESEEGRDGRREDESEDADESDDADGESTSAAGQWIPTQDIPPSLKVFHTRSFPRAIFS